MTAPDGASLERIVPGLLEGDEATGLHTLRLHLERYRFASEHISGGVILDLACGVGYGSALLAATHSGCRIIGADLSAPALQHARTHYWSPAIRLIQGDGAAWLRPRTIDAAVSLETLEHVMDPSALFAGMVSALRPGGVLIASVPVTPSVDANPHHVTDFTARGFLALGGRHGLVAVTRLEQRQAYSPIAVLARRERRTQDLRRGLIGYYLRHPSAFARRAFALARFGFENRYLTVVWRKPNQ
ncbi:MAG: class I SAM-dependent methyltransferase [Gemmatimonadales bacterium]